MSEENTTPVADAAKRFSDEALRVGHLAVMYEATGTESFRKQAALAVKSARIALTDLSDQLAKENGK